MDPGWTLVGPWLDRAWFQRLKLKCDVLLSNFAFKLNWRPYIEMDPKTLETIGQGLTLVNFQLINETHIVETQNNDK